MRPTLQRAVCGRIWLGFGGKLYISQGVYVDCYAEDKTPLAAIAISVANSHTEDECLK